MAMAASICKKDNVNGSGGGDDVSLGGVEGSWRGTSYDVKAGAQIATSRLLEKLKSQLPPDILHQVENVRLTSTSTSNGSKIYFPCPFKETEAIIALKSLEAGVVAALAETQGGDNVSNGDVEVEGKAHKKRSIAINMELAATFLFSTYITTIAGMGKQDPEVKAKLKDTDLLAAQSILYRRLSANLYETKVPGEYFHIHGSLEAGKTLNMIGLEAHRPDLTDYHECIATIESHVKAFAATELEQMNADLGQAGVTALKWDEFKQTEHGSILLSLPPFQLSRIDDPSPPVPLPSSFSSSSSNPQVLSGSRVLELCRVIAGPAMGRTLAEYGAQVIKITSPNLSDVPFFQVDGNTGKHTCDLDLKSSSGRRVFEELLQTADVVLDGYRPGCLKRLGYGPEQIVKLVEGRGKGIIYVSENCFGHQGPWQERPGWQQIADCVTGVAWAQGEFMGLKEPVVPPFPMSDYGTGSLGAIAALLGIFRRATEGGSWVGTTSLCQYDIFLLELGLYSKDIQRTLRQEHDEAFFGLRHSDSVDEVGKRALLSMQRVHPELFKDSLMQKAFSKGFGEEIKWCRSPVSIEGLRVGFSRASRPNGYDDVASWNDWEVEDAILTG
ncbi:hypothetical protein HYALB_00012513 [Hymenoscyphus albidus]|uniref:CoA-transferase family III n=1 Tax=Hymenoscyphus albidus TaxID=595503 RepID=A0A9N9LQL9_9HELO|nr:hypothetical protein HYALB_00012513 [Hymenoscyphus albidus]